MKWLEVSVRTPREFVEPLTEIFYRYGHGGVAVEEDGGYSPDEGEPPPTPAVVTVRTYLPLNATTESRRQRIDLGVSLVAHVAPISPLQTRVVDEVDWENAWKEFFHPLHVGRIVIVPSWCSYQAAPSEVVVTLDPGMAFGTGHHPTTRACLALLERLVAPGGDVLDVGCGSGILSIAAARLGARSVLGLDVDAAATTVAARNVRDNGIQSLVRVKRGSLPDADAPAAGFDVVVANISAKVVCDLAPQLAACARRGGAIVASGVVTDCGEQVERALAAQGAKVVETVTDGDWVTLSCRRA